MSEQRAWQQVHSPPGKSDLILVVPTTLGLFFVLPVAFFSAAAVDACTARALPFAVEVIVADVPELITGAVGVADPEVDASALLLEFEAVRGNSFGTLGLLSALAAGGAGAIGTKAEAFFEGPDVDSCSLVLALATTVDKS